MIIYSIIIITPFILNYLTVNHKYFNKIQLNILWIGYLLFCLIIFGFRDRIGGDWNNYLATFMSIVNANYSLEAEMTFGFNPEFLNLKPQKDSIVFFLLNLFIYKISKSFIVFNLVCSLIYIYSINKFCSILKVGNLIVFGFFTSYLAIVVHMGYVRQSLAISFLALSLYFYFKDKNVKSNILIIFSFLTHIITLPFILLVYKVKRPIYIILLIIFAIVGAYFIRDRITLLLYYYLGDGIHFQSRGAYFRVLLNVPFFLIFLFLQDQLKVSNKEKKFFKICSILLVFSILLLFFERTTLADRSVLNLILFQGYVIGKIFNSLKMKYMKNIFITLTLMYSYLQFYFWVINSRFIDSWLPYKNILYS